MKKIAIAMAAIAWSTSALSTQIVKWEENRFRAVGKGCNMRDTFAIAAGNDVSVLFTNMGVDLGPSGRRTERKACRMVIPAKVRAGYYLAELKQTISAGYERTGRAKGSIALSSNFYRTRLAPLVIRIPGTRGLNPHSEPFFSRDHISHWKVSPQYCQRREYRGLLRSSLVISGQTSGSRSDSILLQADGYDVRFQAHGRPLLCR